MPTKKDEGERTREQQIADRKAARAANAAGQVVATEPEPETPVEADAPAE